MLPDPFFISERDFDLLISFFDHFRSSPLLGVLVAAILSPTDPRALCNEVEGAKYTEVKVFPSSNVFEVICRE